MSWLRIDDGFAQHPKIIRLSPRDRWTWLEVLCYCARYRTDGRVNESIKEVVRGATPAYLNRCYELELLDLVGEHYEVHDWLDYNGKDAKILVKERVRKHRASNAEVTEESVTTALPDRDESVTRAQAPVRVPVPSPTRPSNPVTATEDDAREPDQPGNGTAAETSRSKNFYDEQRLDPLAELRLRGEP